MGSDMTDSALLFAYRAAIEDARTAPKAGFGSYGQNAVFAPANKAFELREEIMRRRRQVIFAALAREPQEPTPELRRVYGEYLEYKRTIAKLEKDD